MSELQNIEIMESYCEKHTCRGDDCKICEEIKNIASLPCDKLWDLRNEIYLQGKADVIDKINKEVDMWWELEQNNSEDDANWYTSIKMLLEMLKGE